MFSKVHIPATLTLNMFGDVGVAGHIGVLPENDYFQKQQSGEDVSHILPLPEHMEQWHIGRFDTGDVLFGVANDQLFVIANSTKFGFALFTFTSRSDLGQGVYRPDNLRAVKQLTKFEEEKQMSIADLVNNAQQYPQVNPMSFQPSMNQAYQPSVQPSVQPNQGITDNQMRRRLINEAMTRAYVYGYVMRSAPGISMKTVTRVRKAGKEYEIKAVESRPSGMQLVLMALPTRCVFRGGSLVTASEVLAGRVDFEDERLKGSMTYEAFDPNAAIAYIGALGNKIPEYGPNVSDVKTQWSAQDILNGKPEVSFVTATPVKSSKSSKVKFTLRSSRGCLFTQKNIMCLKAAEHISTDVKSDKDAYDVNMAAFGRWDCNKLRNQNITQFRAAAEHCPSTIWETTYTLSDENGNEREVKGYGSVFFMNGSTGKADDTGENVVKTSPTFYPWYISNAEKKDMAPIPVERIIKRVPKTTADGKPTVAAEYVLWKDNPKHPMFKPYASFADSIVNNHYVNNERLTSLGSRASAKEKKAYVLSDTALADFKSWLENEDVMSEVTAAMDRSAAQLTLAEAN